jgi:dienelactone hydrolase
MHELQTLTCVHEDVELKGQVARPTTAGPHPVVLIMHTALGLGSLMRRQASRLAQAGYAAVAIDMFGGGQDFHSDATSASAAFTKLLDNPQRLRARTVAWHQLARTLPGVDANRVAAIGYCFGGRCVLELARSGAEVKAVVSYHGLLGTHMPAQPGSIKGVVAVYTGAKDPYAPEKDVEAFRQEMIAAQARWQLTVFGDAEHSFTDPDADAMQRPGIAYNALADHTSWAGTLALLRNELESSR